MRADVGDAQRVRAVDHDPEDAAAAREVADRRVRGAADPARDEALELAAVGVEDPDRGVARAGDLACGLEHLVEHRLGIDEVRQQAAPDLDQPAQAPLVEMVVYGWDRARLDALSVARCGEPAPLLRSRTDGGGAGAA